jgi:putative oxidoreductase
MLLQTSLLVPFALLALRIMTAIVFFSSGKSHVRKPEERGRSIGMSTGATKFLGTMEIIAALSIALGVFAQFGAIIIMAVMLGAMHRKIFVWKTGFYADKGYGWHYDLTWFISALVILATAGGAFTII